jgi:hypothetical protein
VPLRICRVLCFFLLSAGLCACEDWPLYDYLPDPQTERPEIVTIEVSEEPTPAGAAFQSLGRVGTPQRYVVAGAAESCGFDPSAEGPQWPDHPVDADGDGIAESSRSRSGWYIGDLDVYGLLADVPLRLTAELTWSLAPESGVNAPYRPDDPAGPWATESDLDLWMYRLPLANETAALGGDEGVSRAHPETLPAGIVLQAGESGAVGVVCHHGLTSAYQLTLVATPL